MDLDLDKLYEIPLKDVEAMHRHSEVVIKARGMLANIVKVVADAGGAISEEELAHTTLGDFAIIAARNDLLLRADPQRPYLDLSGSKDFSSETCQDDLD
jgi:hypothetical protein